MRSFKKPVLLLLAFAACAPNFAHADPCPQPTSDATGLFAILDGPGDGKLAAVKSYLTGHLVAVDSLSADCETPLLDALKQKDFDVFYYLYQSMGQPDVNATPTGAAASIYLYGVKYGDFSVLSFLDGKDGRPGYAAIGLGLGVAMPTELMLAAYFDRTDLVGPLVLSGRNVNETSSGASALMVAAGHNKTDATTRALLQAGAQFDATDDSSRTALFYAVAAQNTEIIRALIQAGAHVNVSDHDSRTPLLDAVRVGTNIDIVRLLIQAGAQVNLAGGRRDKTVLMYAVENNASAEMVRLLIQTGAQVDATDSNGATALLYAASHSVTAENFKTLLQAGAQPAVTDARGSDLLMYAAVNPSLDLVKAVLEVASDQVNSTDGYGTGGAGNTPLMYAARANSNAEVIRALIAAGAQVNAVNSELMTALMLAAGNNPSVEIIDTLLAAGASINLKDNAGKTALSHARMDNSNIDSSAVISELLAHGARDPQARSGD